MIKYEDHCVGCAVPGYPCIGDRCKYRNVPVHYCDRCGEELSERYVVDDEELCEDCLKEQFRKDLDE